MDKYKFKKTGNIYEVLGEAKMKNSITREWENCIIYRGKDTQETYVRETQDFMNKFEKYEG